MKTKQIFITFLFAFLLAITSCELEIYPTDDSLSDEKKCWICYYSIIRIMEKDWITVPDSVFCERTEKETGDYVKKFNESQSTFYGEQQTCCYEIK